MEWLPEGLKRSLKRKKPPTPVGGGSFGTPNQPDKPNRPINQKDS